MDFTTAILRVADGFPVGRHREALFLAGESEIGGPHDRAWFVVELMSIEWGTSEIRRAVADAIIANGTYEDLRAEAALARERGDVETWNRLHGRADDLWWAWAGGHTGPSSEDAYTQQLVELAPQRAVEASLFTNLGGAE